jgi:hypothetical protein
VTVVDRFELGVFQFLPSEPWQELLAYYDPRCGCFGLG